MGISLDVQLLLNSHIIVAALWLEVLGLVGCVTPGGVAHYPERRASGGLYLVEILLDQSSCFIS